MRSTQPNGQLTRRTTGKKLDSGNAAWDSAAIGRHLTEPVLAALPPVVGGTRKLNSFGGEKSALND
jgi:hypothetical protein